MGAFSSPIRVSGILEAGFNNPWFSPSLGSSWTSLHWVAVKKGTLAQRIVWSFPWGVVLDPGRQAQSEGITFYIQSPRIVEGGSCGLNFPAETAVPAIHISMCGKEKKISHVTQIKSVFVLHHNNHNSNIIYRRNTKSPNGWNEE